MRSQLLILQCSTLTPWRILLEGRALDAIDGEARGFFTCDLSQMNVVEFLLDEDGEASDMLGFGHIDMISSTVVVQSAILVRLFLLLSCLLIYAFFL